MKSALGYIASKVGAELGFKHSRFMFWNSCNFLTRRILALSCTALPARCHGCLPGSSYSRTYIRARISVAQSETGLVCSGWARKVKVLGGSHQHLTNSSTEGWKHINIVQFLLWLLKRPNMGKDTLLWRERGVVQKVASLGDPTLHS